MFGTTPSLCSLSKIGEAAIAIRVQLGDMPAMLGDIVVQLLAEHGEIDIVGRATTGGDALKAARQSRADLLIVRGNSGDPIDALIANARLNILAIDADGHGGTIVRLAHESVTLDRASVGRLARSIVDGDVAGHA